MTKLVKVTNNDTGKSCMTTLEHAKQLQQSGCVITEAQVAKAKADAAELTVDEQIAELEAKVLDEAGEAKKDADPAEIEKLNDLYELQGED